MNTHDAIEDAKYLIARHREYHQDYRRELREARRDGNADGIAHYEGRIARNRAIIADLRACLGRLKAKAGKPKRVHIGGPYNIAIPIYVGERLHATIEAKVGPYAKA